MKNYIMEDDPFIVPTVDMKLIEEHFGNASNKYDKCSIARMEVPPRWKEPAQTPEFDEFTLMVKGKKLVTIDGEKIEIKAGQSILVKKGAHVQYSNPYDYPAVYWSICLPPFSLDTVHRGEIAFYTPLKIIVLNMIFIMNKVIILHSHMLLKAN